MIASLIFFPTKDYTAVPKDYGLKSETAEILTEDNVKITGWFLPAENSVQTVFFLHGNAGNIGDRLFKAAEWVKRGYSVFLLDYRSYGNSEGKITSEEDLYKDARAGLGWLNKKKYTNDNIILYGESIGAAPALEFSKTKAGFFAVILEAPFTSLAAVSKLHYPFVPSAILSAFQFDNLKKISELTTPVFIVHGERDEICPHSMGKELFQAAAAVKKDFFSVHGGMHNDLPDVAGADFYDRPVHFLENLKK